MRGRTLVYAVSGDDYICLRTVNRIRKSPHRFYISRHNLEKLEHNPEIIVRDIHSFAVLRRDTHTGTVEIKFTWLSGDEQSVSGYKETVILPYDKLAVFLRESALEGGSVIWKALSIDNSRKRPKLVFKSRENLRAALENSIVRHKLIRYMRDQFNWPYPEKIEFYDDFVPYSFVFQEIWNGKPAVTGGLILHGQENIKNAHYAIHT